MNLIGDDYGKTELILFLVAIFICVCNVKFWMNLILGPAEASNRRSMPLSEAKEKFYCNTYELCNPINKLKSRIDLYKCVDFFNLRKSNP